MARTPGARRGAPGRAPLLLRVSSGEALPAVRQAAGAAIRALQAAAVSGGEERRTGHWVAAAVPSGIALRIDEKPDDFEGLVRNIAAELESLGAEGSLELYEPEPVAELPEQIDLFECRLRLRGESHHFRGPNWRVLPEAESLESVVEAGIAWCARNAGDLPLTLEVGTMPAVVLGPREDLRAHVRQGLDVSSDDGDDT